MKIPTKGNIERIAFIQRLLRSEFKYIQPNFYSELFCYFAGSIFLVHTEAFSSCTGLEGYVKKGMMMKMHIGTAYHIIYEEYTTH